TGSSAVTSRALPCHCWANRRTAVIEGFSSRPAKGSNPVTSAVLPTRVTLPGPRDARLTVANIQKWWVLASDTRHFWMFEGGRARGARGTAGDGGERDGGRAGRGRGTAGAPTGHPTHSGPPLRSE